MKAALSAGARLTGEVLRRYWPLIAIVLGWWLWLEMGGFTRTVAPGPDDVALDIIEEPSVYVSPLLQTFGTAIVGLGCGMFAGILGGLLVWLSPLASGLIMPTALVIRVVPMTALIPIIARILGYGASSVIVIVVLLVFFPAFALTISGLSTTPPGSTDLFRVFGASRPTAILRLHIPSAVPNIMLALRLSAPLAVSAVLLAEYLTASGGLGDLMRQSRSFLNVEREWAAALVATALSILAFGIARLIEGRARARMT